jgi:lactoylglutathione lyase
VQDLGRSRALYRRLGFKEVANDSPPGVCRLIYGHTWLILSEGRASDNDPERKESARNGPRAAGFVLRIETSDLDAIHEYWQEEGGLVVTLSLRRGERERVFCGLDHDGYELMFEETHANPPRS